MPKGMELLDHVGCVFRTKNSQWGPIGREAPIGRKMVEVKQSQRRIGGPTLYLISTERTERRDQKTVMPERKEMVQRER